MRRLHCRRGAILAVFALAALSVAGWTSPHWLVPWWHGSRAPLHLKTAERVELSVAPKWTGRHMLYISFTGPPWPQDTAPVRVRWNIQYDDAHANLSGETLIPDPDDQLATPSKILTTVPCDPQSPFRALVEVIDPADCAGGDAIVSVRPSPLEWQDRRTQFIRIARLVSGTTTTVALIVVVLLMTTAVGKLRGAR